MVPDDFYLFYKTDMLEYLHPWAFVHIFFQLMSIMLCILKYFTVTILFIQDKTATG